MNKQIFETVTKSIGYSMIIFLIDLMLLYIVHTFSFYNEIIKKSLFERCLMGEILATFEQTALKDAAAILLGDTGQEAMSALSDQV